MGGLGSESVHHLMASSRSLNRDKRVGRRSLSARLRSEAALIVIRDSIESKD